MKSLGTTPGLFCAYMYKIIFISLLLVSATSQALSPLSYKGKNLSPEALIAKLNSVLKDEIAGKLSTEKWLEEFHRFGNSNVEDSQIILVPEDHSDLFSKFVQIQAVRRLANSNDILLAELTDEGAQMIGDCAHFALATLFIVNGLNEDAFKRAMLKDKSVVHLLASRPVWPQSNTMTCKGWDLQRWKDLHQKQRKQLEDPLAVMAEALARHKQKEHIIDEFRNEVLKPYGISAKELLLDGFKDMKDGYFTLSLVNSHASAFMRNRHLIERLREHRLRSPGSKIFVFAGACHVPPPCTHRKACPDPVLEESDRNELREISAFLESQKYVVLAHKALFVDPRLKSEKAEL